MPYITLSSGLTIVVPTKTTRNWADKLQTDTFEKISAHDHTAGGKGNLIGTAALAADSVSDLKILLGNDGYLRGRNFADDADIDILKITTDDELEITNTGAVKINNLKNFNTFTFTDGASNENITGLTLDPTSDAEIGAIVEYAVVRKGTANLCCTGRLNINYDLENTAWIFSDEYTGNDTTVQFDFNGNQLRMSNTANPGSSDETLYWHIVKLGA